MDIIVTWQVITERQAATSSVPDDCTPETIAEAAQSLARNLTGEAVGMPGERVVRGTVHWETADGKRFGGNIA
jgi:hypothetical protein